MATTKKPKIEDVKRNTGVRMTGADVVKSGKNAGTTNANKMLPAGKEDVLKGAKRDVGIAKDTFKATPGPDANRVPTNAASRLKAGGRAASRLLGRAAAVAGAFDAGYTVGEAIENKTGIGKKIGTALADAKGPVNAGQDAGKAQRIKPVGSVAMKEKETAPKKESKPASFNSAFKEARAAGKSTFTYEGKRYTTERADDKKDTGSVREGRNKNIGDDTRKAAGGYAKGGSVKKRC